MLKAFYFLHEFIENSWRNFEQSSEIPIYTFAFTPYPSNTAEFELCTESLEGNVYKYNLKLNKKEVIEESLRVKEGHKTAFSHLFQRNETIKIYKTAGFSFNDIPKNLLRKNCSLISALRQTSISQLEDFLKTIKIITKFGVVDKTCELLDPIYNELYQNKDLLDRLENLLKDLDTGISKINIESGGLYQNKNSELIKRILDTITSGKNKNILENIPTFNVHTIHNIGDKSYDIPLSFESNGIRQLIPLLASILIYTQSGCIFIKDEIERSLHPNILPRILDLFNDKTINTSKSQLIATCNSVETMSSLHKRQFFLLEKNENQESSIICLEDIKGVKNADNFPIKYLSGSYGGVAKMIKKGISQKKIYDFRGIAWQTL